MQMKEIEMKIEEFDIGNIYLDSKEVEEALNSSYEMSKTFYTSYDEKKQS